MSHMGMKYSVQLPTTEVPNPNYYRGGMITVFATDKEVEAYKEWCKERVGANEWNYYGKYRKKPCEFRFKREEDLLAFKLVHGL
jgi:hypothetical protein